MRLYDVLEANRGELLARWVKQVQERLDPAITGIELLDQMPIFIEQLIGQLRPGVLPLPEGANDHAEEHGRQRLRLGFDVRSVVREYGFLEQAVLQLGAAQGEPIDSADLELLSRCINEACSDAVVQYSRQRDREVQRKDAEHVGFLAHEIRNGLSAVRTAFAILQRRAQLPSDRAATTLERNLGRLSDLVDGALADSWLRAGAEPNGVRLDLEALLGGIVEELALEAEAKEIRLQLAVPPLTLHADPRLMRSAVSNVLRNALKFTKVGGVVSVRAVRDAERVRIEVEDSCGGLPPGEAERLFDPFVQGGTDRTGFGFGLAIVKNAVEAHNGSVRVHSLPGHGCIFTIDLPYLPG